MQPVTFILGIFVNLQISQSFRYMKRVLILLIAVLAMSSCSTAIKYISLEQSYNEQWVGRSHADIVATYGAPDRVESDGLDGSILVYETITTVSEVRETVSDVYENKTIAEKEFTHFFIGADNRCYTVKTNLVEVDQESVKRSKRIFWTSYGISFGALLLLFVALVV